MDFKVVIPILGFDAVEELTLEPIDDIFYRLRNRHGETPVFTLIDPSALRSAYVVDLPDNATEKLGLEEPSDAMVLSIMIVDTPLENSHVNFIAPLVFNTKKGLMGQVVLDAAEHPGFGLADPLKKFLNSAEKTS